MGIYWESYYRNTTIVAADIEVNDTPFSYINGLPGVLQYSVEAILTGARFDPRESN
jgi:hypothetical protein